MRGSYAELWSRVAAALPQQKAIIAGEEQLSYATYEERASQLAALLRYHGVQAGDTVAFYLYNCAEYLVAFYASLKIGAVPVSINFRYREKELAALLDNCEASALIYPSSLADVVARMGPKDHPQLLLEVSDSDAGLSDAVAYETLHDFDALDLSGEQRADGTLMVYTGGTTGQPKAVVWDEPDLLEIQMFPTYGALGIDEPETPEDVVAIARAQSADPVVVLPLAPFIHATALFNAMNAMLLGGTVVVLPSPSFSATAAVKAIEEHGVTSLIVAGDAVAIPLMDAWDTDATKPTSDSVRMVMSSGMRFSDETKTRIHALGSVAIVDVLASSEGGPYAIGMTRSAADLPARFQLTPEAVVLDSAMQEIQDQPGAYGILGYRGALPRGYYKDEKKTQEAYPTINGRRYVVPGDHVKVEAERYIELLGRGSSVVNTGGEKVFPAEVEEVLLQYPAVKDAVVFGRPDPRWGERVVAMLAVDNPENVSEVDILDFVGDRLAGYKKPRELFLRESLGRGPTGKLNMRDLHTDINQHS